MRLNNVLNFIKLMNVFNCAYNVPPSIKGRKFILRKIKIRERVLVFVSSLRFTWPEYVFIQRVAILILFTD